jgi:anti-anti-sigma factor
LEYALLLRHHDGRRRDTDVTCAADQLTIRSERDGQAHVVQLVGELDIHTARSVDDELKRVEATDVQEIIVDLRGLDSIGADGLKTFIHASARSRCGGTRLRLLRGRDEVQKTFETAGLLSRLPFVDDRRR